MSFLTFFGKIKNAISRRDVREVAKFLATGDWSLAEKSKLLKTIAETTATLCKEDTVGVIFLDPIILIKRRGNPSGYEIVSKILSEDESKLLESNPEMLRDVVLLSTYITDLRVIPPKTDDHPSSRP